MDINKLIGERIKQRREQLGFTQELLGDSLSLNKSTIQRYEAGIVKKIKLPILHALAKELNVDPNWLALKTDEMGQFYDSNNLLENIDDKEETNNNVITTQNEQENHLITNYRNLNSAGQGKLIDYSDDLVSSNRYVKKED